MGGDLAAHLDDCSRRTWPVARHIPPLIGNLTHQLTPRTALHLG